MTEQPLPAGEPARQPLPAGKPASPGTPSGVRATHADRDRVVEVLRDAAGDGQLDLAELEERVEAALTARTRDELAVLTSDLGTHAARPARDLVRIDQRFGDVQRTGRWEVPQRMEIKATASSVRLDFTEAVISQRTLHLDVDLGIGADLLLITRPGIVVEAAEIAVRLGDVDIRHTADDVVVILTIVLSGRVHGGDVKVRYPRRSFGQWMRREPRPYQ